MVILMAIAVSRDLGIEIIQEIDEFEKGAIKVN